LGVFFAQVVGVAATFVEVWRLVGARLAELDLLAAFAEVAACAPAPYTRPVMLPAEGAYLWMLLS
jgi:DNA mismatch repair protein MSH2